MKVGVVTTPNTKGQIVIPKKYRDILDINESVPLNIVLQGDGLYIHPVASVEAKKGKEYLLKILKKTQGAWAGDKDWPAREKKQRQLEIKASGRRRTDW